MKGIKKIETEKKKCRQTGLYNEIHFSPPKSSFQPAKCTAMPTKR